MFLTFYNKSDLIQQQNIYFQLLSDNSPHLILAFNKENDLFFQNKEIPNNLKYFNYLNINWKLNYKYRYLFQNESETFIRKKTNFNQLFAENTKFFKKLSDEITNFKSGAKYFESFRFKPQFYLIIYRNIENQFENTFLVIYNEKDLVYAF